MKIRNLDEANELLRLYVGLVSRYGGDNQSLERLWPVLELAGNPHEKLKVIHVAGTSGKTSTCYYISEIIASSGSRVGLTVSPHVKSITERVQINNKNIAEDLFCAYLGEFIDLIKQLDFQPSYFELMIVFSLWVFVKEKVDYVVLETGMGGLLDGSNVVTRQDKICVITDIGLDHMHILGDTTPLIAAQKAGIIHDDNVVIMHEQSDEVMEQVFKRSKLHRAEVILIKSREATKNSSLLPNFQKRNWNLALSVAEYVANRDSLALDSKLNPNNIVVPGRMQTSTLEDGSIIILDGAHNAQKIAAFVDSFIDKYPNAKCRVMLALKEGKEFNEVIRGLMPITSALILTTFNTSQDMPAKSQNPYDLEKYANSLGIKTVVIEDHNKAYKELLSSKDNFKLVAGSFYLISQI